MEVYAQAGMEKKRVAQRRAVDVLLDRKPKNSSTEQAKWAGPTSVPKKALLLPEISPKLLR
jgi:hypothetical protein